MVIAALPGVFREDQAGQRVRGRCVHKTLFHNGVLEGKTTLWDECNVGYRDPSDQIRSIGVLKALEDHEILSDQLRAGL